MLPLGLSIVSRRSSVAFGLVICSYTNVLKMTSYVSSISVASQNQTLSATLLKYSLFLPVIS